MNTEELQDFDNFFYYGSGNLETETKSDILQTIIQPSRSLFYDRYYDAAGIEEYENQPNSVTMQVLMPFAITDAIAKRNTVVSANNPDRRIAISQNLIRVKSSGVNGVNVQIQYIPLSDYENPKKIFIPLGVING